MSMRRKTGERILSFLLAVVMLISAFVMGNVSIFVDALEDDKVSSDPGQTGFEIDGEEVSETPSLEYLFTDGSLNLHAYAPLDTKIPEGADLTAVKLPDDSDEYGLVYEAVRAQLGLSENDGLKLISYDVYFASDDSRLEIDFIDARVQLGLYGVVDVDMTKKYDVESLKAENLLETGDEAEYDEALENDHADALENVTDEETFEALEAEGSATLGTEDEEVLTVAADDALEAEAEEEIEYVPVDEPTYIIHINADGECEIIWSAETGTPAPDFGMGESDVIALVYVDKAADTEGDSTVSDEFTAEIVPDGMGAAAPSDETNDDEPSAVADDQIYIKEVAHTNNLTDYGEQLRNYSDSYTMNKVISIPGAKSLIVSIEYGGESTSYDWVCMWVGDYPKYTAASNYGTSLTGKLGGTHGIQKYLVEGDTVTFAFRSDGSNQGDGYGFYAIVETVTNSEVNGVPAWHLEDNATYGGKTLVFDEGGIIYDFIANPTVVSALGSNKNSVTEIRLNKDTTHVVGTAFEGWTSVKAVTTPANSKLETIGPKSFKGCTGLTTANISADVTIEIRAFENCTALKDVTLSGDGICIKPYAFFGSAALETVSVYGDGTVLESSALRNLAALTDVTISGAGTVINSYAFYENKKLENVNITDVDFSETTDLSYMFYECNSLTNIDVADWDLTGVEDISSMFYGCYSLELDISGWNTSSVTNMDYTFYLGPRTITFGQNFGFVGTLSIEPSYWTRVATSTDYYTENLYNEYNSSMAGTYTWKEMGVGGGVYALLYSSGQLVFQQDPIPEDERGTLRYLYTVNTAMTYGSGGSDTNAPTSTVPWYANRTSVTTVVFRDEIIPATMAYWFYSHTALTSVENMENLNTSGLTSMAHTFRSCTALVGLDVSSWTFETLRDLDHTFASDTKLSILTGHADWDISKMTGLTYTFYNCTALTSLDVGAWKLDSMTSLNYTFRGCTALTSLDVSSWRSPNLKTMTGTFYGCTNLQRLDVTGWTTSEVTDMSNTFYNCSALESLNVTSWDTHNVTTTENMFYGCKKLESPDVSQWVTSALTTISYMFYNCESITYLDVSDWDVQKVKTINYAFHGCEALEELDTSRWITTALTNMQYAFFHCYSLKELNMATWDTSKITTSSYMDYAFYLGPRKLVLGENFRFAGTISIDVSNWRRVGTGDVYLTTDLYTAYNNDKAGMADTYVWDSMAVGGGCFALRYSNGDLVFQQTPEDRDTKEERGGLLNTYSLNTSTAYTTSTTTPWYSVRTSVKKVIFADEILPLRMSYWFYGMTALTSVDNMENLNLSGATYINYTFHNCSALTELNVSVWDTANFTSLEYAFYGCSKLVWLDTKNWDLSKLTTLASTFSGCTQLTVLDSTNWNINKVTTMASAFSGCSKLQVLDTSGWDFSKVTTMNYAFSGCSSLTGLDTSNWNFAVLTTLSYTFQNCSSLEHIDVGSWDVSKVTTMNYAFAGCTSLVGLNVENWKFSSSITLSRIFYNCTKLETLDVSEWNMASVTTLDYAFYNCASLDTLEVGNWTLTNLTSLEYAFYGCTGFTTLDVGNWNLAKLTNMSRAFQGCTNLETLDVSKWTLTALTNMSYAFSGCSSLEELDVENWNVSKVTNFSYAFSGCASLTELKTGGWTTSAATNLSYMFQNCTGLTSIDVKNWNTSSVTTAQSMLNGTVLTTLDISGWDTAKMSNSSIADPASIVEITFGPKVDVGTYNHFVLGGTGAKWVEKVADEDMENQIPMTVSEFYAQHRATPRVATYYKVRPITFDANGGYASPSSFAEWWPGKSIGELPGATRRGADFLGWFTERVGGEQIHDGLNPTQDTYYAHWYEHKYTLVLVKNDEGYEQHEYQLEYNDSYVLSDKEFERESYVIVGWNTRADGSGTEYNSNEEVLQLTEVDGDVIYLFAQWVSLDNIVYVSFDSMGGTAVSTIMVERGDPLGKLPTPYLAGYSFIGWHIGSEDGELATASTIVDGDMILYAEWAADVKVRFDFNKGLLSTTLERTVHYNSAVGSLPTDLYLGRFGALMGWFTEPEGGEKIDEKWIITEEVTFYAHWGWRPKFSANGGKFTTNSLYDPQEGSLFYISELPEAVYDGYEIEGWYQQLSDGTERKVEIGDTVDLEEGIVIMAHWQHINTVKITLVPNGGTINNSTNSVVYEVYNYLPVSELPYPKRTGYEFAGWLDMTSDPQKYCDKNTIFPENATLFAQWIAKDVTVTFVKDADDAVFSGTAASAGTKTVTVPSGDTLDTIIGCARPDHILEGWYTEPNGEGEKLTKDTILDEDVTYYAHWTTFLNTFSTGLHQYTYGAEWFNGNSTNSDNAGYNLEFHPTSNTTQTAILHVYFELNDAVGIVAPIPAGALSVKIPKYIFYDKNGNPLGGCDVEEWLAPYPTVGGQKFSYETYTDEDGVEYYILKNNQPLETGGIDFNVSYSVLPNQLEGGATNSDGRYVDDYDYYQYDFIVEFEVDEDPENGLPPQDHIEKELSVEMHTKVETTASKAVASPAFSYTWSKTWGEEPDDAGEYFYITWYLRHNYQSSTNQASTFKWDEYITVHDGTVVYMSTSGASGSHAGNGSTNGSTSCTVVTKHPTSLLENIPSTGLTFYNEAIVTETWASGYETEHRVSASTKLYSESYPSGHFDKRNERGSVVVRQGGQETIWDDNEEVSMPWHITYDGGDNMRPTWDEDTKTYTAPQRTLRFRDGVQGDLMYSSGRASSKYVWEPDTGNIDLNDDDYYFTSLTFRITEYDAISEGGVWSSKIANNDTSMYGTIIVLVRYRYSDEFTPLNTYNYTPGGVTLNFSKDDGIVGFEVQYSTAFYWTSFEIDAGMKLVPSSKIRSLIRNDLDGNTTSLIKNKVDCAIWYTEQGEEDGTFLHWTNYTGDINPNSPANRVIYELNVSTTNMYTYKECASKDKVKNDNINGIQDIAMMISGYNVNTAGRKKKMTTGVFYDLLPSGTTVDPTSVVCFGAAGRNHVVNSSTITVSYPANSYDSYIASNSSSRLPASLYDIQFVPNWEGSGRTMMIIKVAQIEEKAGTGFTVLYLLRTTYDNIRNYGTTLTNDVAFLNTTGGSLPEHIYDPFEILPDMDEIFYQDLYRQNMDNIGFAIASTNYSDPPFTTWGFDKMISSNGSPFSVSTTALAGDYYTYRMEYSQSAEAVSKYTVLYDVIEKSAYRRDSLGRVTDSLESKWHGTVQAVRVETSFQEPGDPPLAYSIYYSVLPRDTFSFESIVDPTEFDEVPYDLHPECNLGDTRYWTKVESEDWWKTEEAEAIKPNITAIAVDFSKDAAGGDYIMSGKSVIQVYVDMRAPIGDVSELIGDWTYNEGVIYGQKGQAESLTPLYSDAQIELEEVNPDLEKESDPAYDPEVDPVTGEKNPPTLIEFQKPVNYTLKISNNDPKEISLYNIVVEDTIPDGMQIIQGDIKIHFGDPKEGVTPEFSPRISEVVREGQYLRFKISSLNYGEVMHIEIPVLVTVTKSIFENTAYIPEVNDVIKDIPSDTLYHEVKPSATGSLVVIKNMIGRPSKQIEAGEFEFQAKLIMKDGVMLPASEQKVYTAGTTGSNGICRIGPMDYSAETEGHVYTYEITEINKGADRIIYSDEKIYAEVTIEDDGTGDGDKKVFLVANTVYKDAPGPEGNIITGSPIISNKYKMDGFASLELTKLMTGDERVVGRGEFNFTAVQVDSETREVIENAVEYHGSTTGEGGKATINGIPFNQDDVGNTYTFRITEDAGDLPGVTYSDEVIYAEITVVIDDRNELAFNTRYYRIAGGERIDLRDPTITNGYTDAKGDLTVSKIVSGRNADTSKVFHFTVTFTMGETPLGGLEIAYEGGGGKTSGTVTLDEYGSTSFTLSHGQSVTFKDVPAGARYVVVETDAYTDRYAPEITQTRSGVVGSPVGSATASGSIPWGDVDIVAYENAKTYPLPMAGGIGTYLFYIMGLVFVLSAAGLAYLNIPSVRRLFRRRERRNRA